MVNQVFTRLWLGKTCSDSGTGMQFSTVPRQHALKFKHTNLGSSEALGLKRSLQLYASLHQKLDPLHICLLLHNFYRKVAICRDLDVH